MTIPSSPDVAPPEEGARNTRDEALRERHCAAVQPVVAAAFERLRWPAARLREERERRLRALIAHARQRSPWHAARLANVDATRLTEAGLRDLPTMTKHDLMANFDEIATDRRLTLQLANRHLARLGDRDSYLLDAWHAVATSGATGRRGVFVYDWDGWMECYATVQRYAFAYALAAGMAASPQSGFAIAQVAANQATHMTYALTETFRSPQFRFHQFPVTLPLPHIVGGLNAAQPIVLQGYPSMLGLLAQEAAAERLRIAPRLLIGIGEPLYPSTRERLARAFPDAPVQNWWGCSETSGLAMSCGAGAGMHLSDDTLIIELVDEKGAPIAPGQTAAKMFVTNLFNWLTPLIRYELSDQPTLLDEPCPCGSAHRRVADLQGRHEEIFVYNDARGGQVSVHPKVFTSVLFSQAGILDYQVWQTARGAVIDFLPAEAQAGGVDAGAVGERVARALAALGVPAPKVVLKSCHELDRRHGGKLVRHVPLDHPSARRHIESS